MIDEDSTLIIQHSTLKFLSLLHPLEDLIVLAVHAEARVNLLRGNVAAIDVETDAAYARIRVDDLLHVLVQACVDSLASIFRAHVDALNPPDNAVAPVAPFVRDEQRSHDPPI